MCIVRVENFPSDCNFECIFGAERSGFDIDKLTIII